MKSYLNEQQKQALEETAIIVENGLREGGLMSYELCSIAETILENNLHGAKEELSLDNKKEELLGLIAQAEELLDKFKNLH